MDSATQLKPDFKTSATECSLKRVLAIGLSVMTLGLTFGAGCNSDTQSETVDAGNPVVVNDATVGGGDATIEDNDTAIGDNDAGMNGPTRLLVTRITEQITLVESRTQEFNGNTWVLNFYRNEAYTCGLSGYYTFMVMEPANNPGVEAPLWVYQHGGGYGWFDEDQVYQTVKTLTMDTWNHEETFDDFINKHLLYNTCLLYTSPSPRDQRGSRMPSSA